MSGSVSTLTKSIVSSRYVEPLLAQGCSKQLSVKTVRNKLRCLEYFCKFTIDLLGGRDDEPVIVSLCHELMKLQKCLPSWRQALRSKCSLEDVKRRVLDGAERVDPTDISNYHQSDYATYAIRLLRAAIECGFQWTPSMYDFTRARNHMLVILSVSNAHRSGVLINFSLKDYENGLKAFSENTVFSVCEHKTVSTQGAATIAVSADEAKLLTGYMVMRLNAVFQTAAPYVVINTTGTQMTQSNVAASLTAAVFKGGSGIE
jgi:hypothetical protein